MKVAIMQPYFMPYIGYFQLIAAVNTFVVYDNIKYTKKGWINRNRMLGNGADVTFSLPLKKDSDFLDVRDRELAADFSREKLLNKFKGAYQRAPQFDAVFPLAERIVNCEDNGLFNYIHNSLTELCAFMSIDTEICISSDVEIDHALKSGEKVMAICRALDADCYINAIGGVELYEKAAFAEQNLELKFIKSMPFEYPQFGAPFVPWLSILDVLMFNRIEVVRDCINSNYELV